MSKTLSEALGVAREAGLANVRGWEERAAAINAIDALLSSLRDQGFKIVGREPSEEMSAAVAPRPAHWPPEGVDHARDAAVAVDQLVLRQHWSAMWDAAPEVGT